MLLAGRAVRTAVPEPAALEKACKGSTNGIDAGVDPFESGALNEGPDVGGGGGGFRVSSTLARSCGSLGSHMLRSLSKYNFASEGSSRWISLPFFGLSQLSQPDPPVCLEDDLSSAFSAVFAFASGVLVIGAGSAGGVVAGYTEPFREDGTNGGNVLDAWVFGVSRCKLFDDMLSF